jgi:hypothetical protein
MIALHGNAWFFDVDDTLVIWGRTGHPEAKPFNNSGYTQWLVPHQRHIELLKTAKFRGHKVIVWSAGGSEWAEEVVKMLELENYVDLVISKPSWYVDDLPASEFMPSFNRVYMDDYGKKVVGAVTDPLDSDGGSAPQD